ncbi:MAG TPA: sialate O-acetylesterase [Lacipirellula sp.]
MHESNGTTQSGWRSLAAVAGISALLFLIVGCQRVIAADIDVYVLTGQSNSLGTTADPNESNHGPGGDSSDAATRFFWSNVSSANGSYPIGSSYGNSAGSITTLQAQQGDGGANSLFWGPEFGFARAMSDAGHTNVMVVKASRGGGGNSLWSKAAFQSNPNSGHMYQHVLDTVSAATAELTSAGHTFRIAGLLYLQGESDSAAEAPLAGQRLAELVSNLRADLPHAANMHAVVGGIAASGSTRDLVRARQSALALADPKIDYFSNLDLAGSLYDGLHFDKPAKLEIGRRYAQHFLQAAGELPLVESVGFSAVADASDATRMVFDSYVPDIDGAPPGTNLVHPGVFNGFVDGVNGQPRVGLLVETSDGQVTFGDRHPQLPSSDLIVGAVDLPPPPPRIVANTVGSGFGGKWLSFTFVDPLDPERQASVASVAFELGFVAPEDQIIATFLDRHGNVLHRTGELSNGSFGFASRAMLGGALASNIHQVVVAGSSNAGWTIGHARSLSVADLSFQGFRVVPEPNPCVLGAAAMYGLLTRRRRRCDVVAFVRA